MTTRLFHQDPFLLSFDATVALHAEFGGTPSVILNETAFYPESGGQLGDRGMLAGMPVKDVQTDDAGLIHHLLEGAPPAVGTRVHGDVDKPRRRIHMALHTGQHMLSRALMDVLKAETVSSRLGDSTCTIDLDKEKLDEAALARAEDLCNAVVDDDVLIRAFFPSSEELAALPLRRKPKVTENIRVIQIADFDVSPCGGTHCTRSAQVGLVRITGVERYKGKMRVTFNAGKRARDGLVQEAEALRVLGRDFTCGPLDVAASVDKLRKDLTQTRETLGLMRARMAEEEADALVKRAQAHNNKTVVALFDDGGQALLRAVAKRITAVPDLVAILAVKIPEGLHVMLARGSTSTLDCGAFLKALMAAGGGRGGGRAETAEGKLPPGADFHALVASQPVT